MKTLGCRRPVAHVLMLLFLGDWEEANSLLARASELETFKPDGRPKFHLQATFTFHHTDKDETGRVQKAAAIEWVHPIIDSAAVEAVKHWTFEPKLCYGKPVKAVTRLDVRFH